MRRSVDGDYFPTLRRLGPGLLRLGRGFGRRAASAARWTGKALVVLIVVLAVAHGIATFITGRKLKADLAALRAKGELPSITELAGPMPPDAENAALVYARAFRLLPKPDISSPDYEQLSLFADVRTRSADPESWEKARALVRKYEKALEIAERAASMEKCRFPVEWEGGYTATFKHYHSLRQLAILTNASALVAAKDGRMEEALRYSALSLRIADSISEDPILIGVLVRRAIISMTCRNLQEILRYGDLDDEQTQQLSDLLTKADLRPHYRKAMQGERATGIVAFRQVRDDPAAFTEANDMLIPLPRLTVFIARSLLYSDERFFVRHMGKIIADADRSLNVSQLEQLEQVHQWYTPISSFLMPLFSYGKTAVYESLAETHISRIALELGAYQRRNGEYPDSLARLRITGAEVLTDPFSGEDFVYHRRAKGFVLYSIGKDMKDDGGHEPPIDRDEDRGDIVWRME